MKHLIFLLLSLMVFISAQSQVDTIADNIYVNDGNLGIGTDTPHSQLEINRPEGHPNGATLYLKHGKAGSHLGQNASRGLLHLYRSDITSQTILRSYGDSNLNVDIGNVGIGTDNPKTKLQVTDGDIYVSDINRGIIMKSPDGTCWRGTLDNTGNLFFSPIDCPEGNNYSSISNRMPEIKTQVYFQIQLIIQSL